MHGLYAKEVPFVQIIGSWNSWILKTEPVGRPETSVKNCHFKVRKIAEVWNNAYETNVLDLHMRGFSILQHSVRGTFLHNEVSEDMRAENNQLTN